MQGFGGRVFILSSGIPLRVSLIFFPPLLLYSDWPISLAAVTGTVYTKIWFRDFTAGDCAGVAELIRPLRDWGL